MKVSILVLATLFLILPHAFSDSVMLNSGEVIQGTIVSETDTQIVIEVSNYNRTITNRRLFLRSDIKIVQRESVQQRQERQAVEAIAPLQLDSNREFSKTEYERGIETFNQFLMAYPESKFTDDIRQKIALWKAELSHLENGEVKFDNRWMPPGEKQPLVDKSTKEQRVQTITVTLQSLRKTLDGLGYQRQKLAESIAQAGQSVMDAQNRIANAPRVIIPASQTLPSQPGIPASPYYDARGNRHSGAGERIVGDPVVVKKAQTDLAFYQAQVNQGQQQLAALNRSINDTKQRIAKTESEYQIALAKLQEQPPAIPKPAPIVQPTVSPQPVAATPKPNPWIVRNWKKLALGSGILLVLLILLAYPLKRMAARARVKRERVLEERGRQRRAAREQLKKIFDRIFIEGERPPGQTAPEGEIVPIGSGQNASGGGRWFVIGPDYIWAVHNNGADNDNWALNNVITDGPGAVGARVTAEVEVANSIKTLAKAAR